MYVKILSNICHVFQRCLENNSAQLTYLYENNILYNKQFRFPKEHAILELVNELRPSTKNKFKAGVL